MGRSWKRKHNSRFTNLCYFWQLVFSLWNWRWKSEKSRKHFFQRLTGRGEFSDVIPRLIHKRTKYSCYKNIWYRRFSCYSLQDAKILSRLKVWLEVSLTSNNTLRYINLNKIYQSFGYKLCRAKPGCLLLTLNIIAIAFFLSFFKVLTFPLQLNDPVKVW